MSSVHRNIVSNILKFISSPFTCNLSFFAVLFVMASLVDFVAWIAYGEVYFAFYFMLHGWVMCYVLCHSAIMYSPERCFQKDIHCAIYICRYNKCCN